MAKVRAYLYEVDGFVFVYPPVSVLKKGDTFELINTADEAGVWSVPEGPFEGGAFKDEPIPKKHSSSAKTVRDHPFLVVKYNAHVGGKRAIGRSDPIIIIDP